MHKHPTNRRRRDGQILTLVPTDQILDRTNSLSQAIAIRAFEIFRERGHGDGHALEDWFQAEAELFHPLHLDVRDSEGAVFVRGEVPGYGARDLEVCVEPRRVTIAGERQPGYRSAPDNVIYSDDCLNRIFRIFNFPAEVDAHGAQATVCDGLLEIVVPKFRNLSKIYVLPKTDWLVRADDVRAWCVSTTR
jgi:HSP20 family protein